MPPLAEIRALKGLSNLYPKEVAAEKEVKVKMPKPPKEIPKRSDNQKVVIAELKKLYPVFLKKHPTCEIDGPGCTQKATCAHHTEGRLPSKVLDTTKWVASCTPCNTWVEVHHAEAAKKGFKKSKF
jgi:hypothetical protein